MRSFYTVPLCALSIQSFYAATVCGHSMRSLYTGTLSDHSLRSLHSTTCYAKRCTMAGAAKKCGMSLTTPMCMPHMHTMHCHPQAGIRLKVVGGLGNPLKSKGGIPYWSLYVDTLSLCGHSIQSLYMVLGRCTSNCFVFQANTTAFCNCFLLQTVLHTISGTGKSGVLPKLQIRCELRGSAVTPAMK